MSRTETLSLDFDLMPPEAVDCTGCLDRVQERLRLLQGVSEVSIDSDRRRIRLGVEGDVGQVAERARRVMSDVASGFGHEAFRIGGMDCPGCAKEIESGLGKVSGILSCSVDFPTARMRVEFDRSVVDASNIKREVRQLGFTANSVFSADAETPVWEVATLVIGAALFASAVAVPGPEWVKVSLYCASGLVSGWRMLYTGILSIFKLNFTMNALMTVAIIGAAAIREWPEAALVAWLFALGNVLQSRANRRTRSALRELMDAAPQVARVRVNGVTEVRAVSEIVPGEIVEVLPFEQIPLDGEVIQGSSTINNASLTGESEPQFAGTGSKVLAGGMNENGLLHIRVDRKFSDTTFARTLDLIERGQSSRSPQQAMIDRFSAVYTPTVITIAFAFALITGLSGYRPWNEALHQAFWLLMVACPCALILSTPVAVVSAIGGASKFGALIRGGAYLEALSRARNWIFDKTGTLTHARLEVEGAALADGVDEQEALDLAFALASSSGHPISRAIARFCESKGANRAAIDNVTEQAAQGISADFNGKQIRLGSAAFTGAETVEAKAAHLSADGMTIATFFLSEKPKVGSREAIAYLESEGIDLTLLSGDSSATVASTADQLGIRQRHSELLPDEKAGIAERLSKAGGVVMVGDGINDVAALQRSDVAVAMGAAGSEPAIEAADIVVLNDDIASLRKLHNLSKRYRSVVAQNITFSLLTKAGLVIVGVATGPLPFWIAVAGDMGVSLLVTANAMRLRR